MLQKNTLEFLHFIKGDTKKTELILTRRLSKLSKSTCKLLKIDLKFAKVPDCNTLYDMLQSTIKINRLIQRAVKSKFLILSNPEKNMTPVDHSVSRETELLYPKISAKLDRKME